METATFSLTQGVGLALSWTGYFVLHSILADQAVRRHVQHRWPTLGRYYRLLYALAATVLILPPLYLLYAWSSPPLWAWHGVAGWIANGMAVLALAGFALSTRAYDMAAFLGLRLDPEPDNATGFHLSPAHRFVRHPWYFFGLVILWTRDMPPSLLVSAVCITVYLVVGSRLEENKLVAEFGDRYRRYQAAVPGLLPWPGRYLSRAAARELAGSAAPDRPPTAT